MQYVRMYGSTYVRMYEYTVSVEAVTFQELIRTGTYVHDYVRRLRRCLANEAERQQQQNARKTKSHVVDPDEAFHIMSTCTPSTPK